MPFIIQFGIANILRGILSKFMTGGFLGWTFIGFSILAPLIKKILYLIGFTTVTVYGLHAAFDEYKSVLVEQIGQLPVDVASMLGLMKIDIAFTMVISAIVLKSIIRGWDKATDTATQTVWRKPRVGSNPWDSGPGSFEA